MPTYVDHQQMVDLLHREYGALAELCRALTPTQWATPSCLPGWTVHDVLAHVVGTESMLAGQAPPEADISHLVHMRNPIAESNELWVESMRPLTGSELVARFELVTGERLKALDAMTQADFDAPSWTPAGKDETYGRFMRIRHYDCFLHEHDIRGAIGAPPRPDVADVTSALAEVETGLGYIVGRRARLPEGSSVRIDLDGPVERTYLVAVEARAAVVDSLEGAPTVTLSMPAPLFLRLTGGRDDGVAPTDAGAVVGGDPELGARLLANLAFTI
jgi:uncharacterized protein (TIGR03083 family)